MNNKMKMFRPIFTMVFALFGLTFLPNCARQRTFVSNITKYDYECVSNDVKVSAKAIDKADKTLTSNRKILRKYQPVELKIENYSCDPYSLEQRDIEIIIAPIKEVTKSVKRNMFVNGVLCPLGIFTFLQLISFPLICPCCMMNAWLLSCFVGSVETSIGGTILVGFSNVRTAKRLRRSSMDIDSRIIINPNSQIRIVIFAVKEAFKSKFNITLVNRTNDKKLSFEVDLL